MGQGSKPSPPLGDFQGLVFLDKVHIGIPESACLQLNHRWVRVPGHVKVDGVLVYFQPEF